MIPRSLSPLMALVPLLAIGCGPSQPLSMATTPELSRQALVLALDGWKAGQSVADLGRGSPAVLFVDSNITRGDRLRDYRLEGAPPAAWHQVSLHRDTPPAKPNAAHLEGRDLHRRHPAPLRRHS